MARPRVSVVICAYSDRRWNDLVAAVTSVRAQSVEPAEIVVVVDHNPALLMRARVALPVSAVVENGASRGLSGARNSGVAATSGEVVAFLDDDAVAEPTWLECLVAPYADRRVVGVGGAIVPAWDGGRPRAFPDEFDWVVGCTYRGMPRAAAPVRNLIGCNMSFRRGVFGAVGGFCSGLGRLGSRPVGGEETEFCIRLRQHQPDAVLLYEPAAVVRHRVTEDRAGRDYFRSRCYAEGLSKALVSRSVGTQDGLASEWAYTMRVLPRGIIRGLADGALRGDLGGLERAAAVAAGLAITTWGYAVGCIRRRLGALAPDEGGQAVVRSVP